jgi:hypothetical protein
LFILAKFPVLILTRNDYHVCGQDDLVTDEDYNDIYQEALYCLGEDSSIGFPFRQANGNRVCEVDGRLLPDDQVMELWWGKGIAEQIRRERSGNAVKPQSTRS